MRICKPSADAIAVFLMNSLLEFWAVCWLFFSDMFVNKFSTTIESSIVKNSIIGSFSNLFDIVLDDSLIGSDTTIRGETRTLNIGDNTDIDLG